MPTAGDSVSRSNTCEPAAAAVALLATTCGGGRGVTVEPLGDTPSDHVLSSCEPAGDQGTAMLVEASGELPLVTTMEQAVADHPDAEFMIDQLLEEGQSREDALHKMYAQVVGQQLFADAQQLPGFLTGAYARPEDGEPFELSFSGAVPEDLDPRCLRAGIVRPGGHRRRGRPRPPGDGRRP